MATALDLLRSFANSNVTPPLGLGRLAFAPGPTTPLANNTAMLLEAADFDGDL